jgi:hypothetical protein
MRGNVMLTKCDILILSLTIYKKTLLCSTNDSLKCFVSVHTKTIQVLMDEYCYRFREELKHISQTIKQRNATRAPMFQYPYLDPERIPNAINA